MNAAALSTDLSVGDAIGHAIIWIVLSIFTLGFALMLYPYSLAKYVIGKTYLLDENGRRSKRFKCDLGFTGNLGHAVVWFLLSLITFGLAYFIYIYRVWVYAIGKTSLVPA